MDQLDHKPPYDFREGSFLLINKPKTWSSFHVVKKVKYATRSKVGHAGTLDPLATGLLLLCTGRFTKKLSMFSEMDKEYVAKIKFGSVTASYDREGEEQEQVDVSHLQWAEIEKVLENYKGEITQLPPMYSAIKREGKRLYKLARKGQKVTVPPRPVTLHKVEVEGWENPFLTLRILCSKGTYIRSLAHDIGQDLNVGGYLYDLERTAIGPYRLEDAWEIEELSDYIRQTKS